MKQLWRKLGVIVFAVALTGSLIGNPLGAGGRTICPDRLGYTCQPFPSKR